MSETVKADDLLEAIFGMRAYQQKEGKENLCVAVHPLDWRSFYTVMTAYMVDHRLRGIPSTPIVETMLGMPLRCSHQVQQGIIWVGDRTDIGSAP